MSAPGELGWRAAAEARLAGLAGATRDGSAAGPRAAVRRVSVEVEVAGRSELVVLAFAGDGGLRAVASDGAQEGPHVEAALAWLASGEDAPGTAARSGRVSVVPGPAPGAPAGDRGELADALDELLTTAVRLGAQRAADAGLEEATERLLAAAPTPPPWALARALGRLRAAAVREDLGAWARVLDGMGRLALALREGRRTWLDDETPERVPATLTDRRLVELGRERVAGLSRGSLERRLLVCVRSGEVFAERLSPGETGSVGPCPRVVEVGLAERLPAPTAGLRLLQYSVRADVPAEVHARLRELAAPRLAPLLAAAQAAWRDAPVRAEPFAIVATTSVRGPTPREPRGRLEAADGALALSGDAGIGARLAALSGLHFVTGRLVPRDTHLAFRPLMAGGERDGAPYLERLR
ncbi:MAG: hypothetical protein AAF447_03590 [Myxococcota bacterium]